MTSLEVADQGHFLHHRKLYYYSERAGKGESRKADSEVPHLPPITQGQGIGVLRCCHICLRRYLKHIVIKLPLESLNVRPSRPQILGSATQEAVLMLPRHSLFPVSRGHHDGHPAWKAPWWLYCNLSAPVLAMISPVFVPGPNKSRPAVNQDVGGVDYIRKL